MSGKQMLYAAGAVLILFGLLLRLSLLGILIATAGVFLVVVGRQRL